MPLTIAHPAAVIPLARHMKKYGIFSALIIGSLMPDFSYFLFLPITREQTHSLAGMFWFCLPVGLLVYAVFHGLMKGPLLSLMPMELAARVEPYTKDKEIVSREIKLLKICISIFGGTATHLLWDSFTHEGGFMVEALPFLNNILFRMFGYKVYAFKILQHGSTIIGVSLLLFWFFQWYQKAEPVHESVRVHILPFNQRVFWISMILFVGVWVGLSNGHQFSRYEVGAAAILREYARGLVINGSSTVGGLLLIYSVTYQALKIQMQKAV